MSKLTFETETVDSIITSLCITIDVNLIRFMFIIQITDKN